MPARGSASLLLLMTALCVLGGCSEMSLALKSDAVDADDLARDASPAARTCFARLAELDAWSAEPSQREWRAARRLGGMSYQGFRVDERRRRYAAAHRYCIRLSECARMAGHVTSPTEADALIDRCRRDRSRELLQADL
jgi:hypothetical protein